MIACSASKTVCGEKWLMEFTAYLNEKDQEKVKYYNSTGLRRFRDREKIQANREVRISVYTGNTSVQINADVVTKDLPHLLSKPFMKRANIVVEQYSKTALVVRHERSNEEIAQKLQKLQLQGTSNTLQETKFITNAMMVQHGTVLIMSLARMDNKL